MVVVAAPAPQVAHGVPKPPPGFCQAYGLFDCTARVLQNHWPLVAKSMTACTETQ